MTAKQGALALAYLETGNASAAYREVYDVSSDTEPEAVNRMAHELVLSRRNWAIQCEKILV